MAENPSNACEGKGLPETMAPEVASAPAALSFAKETGLSQQINAADNPQKLTCDCTTAADTAENFSADELPDNSLICPSIGSEGDSIPQWKKDLIQRRKTNIARTIGANHSTYCQKKGQCKLK